MFVILTAPVLEKKFVLDLTSIMFKMNVFCKTHTSAASMPGL